MHFTLNYWIRRDAPAALHAALAARGGNRPPDPEDLAQPPRTVKYLSVFMHGSEDRSVCRYSPAYGADRYG